MGLKEFFKPRQDKFLQLLIEQAEITLHGMDALESYMKKRSDKHAVTVRQAEKDADEVRRILIDELNRTFVTPIDREDLFALSRAIDDVMDYAYATVEEMEVLDVEPNDYLRRLVSLLQDAAEEIHLSMLRLKKNPGVASRACVSGQSAGEPRGAGISRGSRRSVLWAGGHPPCYGDAQAARALSPPEQLRRPGR